MTNKKHWRDVYVSDYLASWDIDSGKMLTLTIKKCVEEKAKLMGDPVKVIAYFEEDYKPMIVNPTNCKIMQTLTGEGLFEDWAGIRISVFVEEKRTKTGELKNGLSIYKKLPKEIKKKEELTEDHEKWETVKKKIKDEKLEPEYFETWFVISDENKKLLIS